MGKGDKKTKRGKIANNSYGARRPRKIKRKPSVEEKIKVGKKK
ncbi:MULTISPECIES: 30S ribosomal protein THX [Maribacter]|jgi:30S ribosomal protein S31|uniref:30S ribosomal protein THX n=2 Tax=Maribacter TaxID=252356 RepID=A0A5B2TPC9_9FLAO|nr:MULTISPECIES: 30S ribosomal protein THX [Maribacter]KAA2216013.1 30S ribosomal protein THX [Maribacter flavus]MDC6406858.1 30S ribosomal protein THX [Maribacter sp. PR66]MEE1973976.1 30S ribosomal protein THX [Maribacter flavus]TLF41598.1 30S ribosomal protein THX [Maribacter aurantiacus]